LATDIRDANLELNAYIMGAPFDLEKMKSRFKLYGLIAKDTLKDIFTFGISDSEKENQAAMFAAIQQMEERFKKLEEQGERTTQKIDFSNIIRQLNELKTMFVTTDIEGEMNDGSAAVVNLDKSYKDLNTTLSETAVAYDLIGEHMDKNLAESHSYFDSLKAGFKSYADSVKKGTLSIASITGKFMQGAEDAIVNMIMGVKFSWKGLFRAIMADITRILVRKALTKVVTGLLGFAGGGRPPEGRPSIVGERGAEVFVPDSAGTIIPNDQLGGTNNTKAEINFNVQAIDASSFNSYLVNNRDTIESIINTSLLQNGSVRRTIQMTA